MYFVRVHVFNICIIDVDSWQKLNTTWQVRINKCVIQKGSNVLDIFCCSLRRSRPLLICDIPSDDIIKYVSPVDVGNGTVFGMIAF